MVPAICYVLLEDVLSIAGVNCESVDLPHQCLFENDANTARLGYPIPIRVRWHIVLHDIRGVGIIGQNDP